MCISKVILSFLWMEEKSLLSYKATFPKFPKILRISDGSYLSTSLNFQIPFVMCDIGLYN